MVLVGRVGLEVKGAWDSSVAYATMDVVTYNNSTYIAKQAVPAGTLPTNTTYWELSLDASLLQTKTMSSPVMIGGESKTTVEAAVGALEDVKADKTAISSVETTNTAVSAHSVGSYFINASGQFVKTTSAIAIGDTIDGNNTTATSIVAVLDEINNLKQPKTLSNPITIAGTVVTTVEEALSGLNLRATKSFLGRLGCEEVTMPADLNNLTPGQCVYGGFAAFAGVGNIPNGSFAGMVYCLAGYNTWQLAKTYNSAGILVRGYTGSVWTQWFSILVES